jgi:hypothetical protein
VTPAQLAAARRSRYAARKRAEDPDRERANRRRQDQRQRWRLIAVLGGRCCQCDFIDHRGLVIVQPFGQRLTLHQLYTLSIHEPDVALTQLRLVCATCRQIEVFEHGRHHEPSVAPSMSSPDVHPSASDDHPFVSSRGAGPIIWGWAESDGVAFG